jgi:acyl-CoA thioesterase YciA
MTARASAADLPAHPPVSIVLPMSDYPHAAPGPAPAEPQGELVIRTIAMPADTNANGDIFGGWLMSQMDLGAAIIAKNISRSRVTTVAVDGMVFHNPVYVGDIVNCHARLLKVGRTSMRIDIQAWVQRGRDGTLLQVTEGIFTYVAIDENGRPHPVHR